MTVLEHVYPLPDDEELDALIGSATPHFALQIRERIVRLAETLAEDDPRRARLQSQIARLEQLAASGAATPAGGADLPTRPSNSA